MRKTKTQIEADERRYYAEQAARGPSAIPVGACIVRPGSRGVIGIKPPAVPAPDPKEQP